MKRTKSKETVLNAVRPYMDEFVGFDVDDLCNNDQNIILEDGGSVSILEYVSSGLYTVHYFFLRDCRGRRAIKVAREMLKIYFNDYPVEVMRGYTPVENKAAIWMNRQLGFKSYGIVDTLVGECEIYIQTKKEFQ